MHISHISIICICALSSTSFISASEDHYSILGVSRSATTREIKRAFRKKAHMYHPDKNKSKEAEKMFLKINQAHDILTNKEKRAQYDQFGDAAFSDGGQSPFDFSGFSFNKQGNNNNDGGSIFDSFDNIFSGFDSDFHSGGHFGDMFGDFGDDDDGDMFQFMGSSSSHSERQNCRTITQKVGNTYMTTTECS